MHRSVIAGAFAGALILPALVHAQPAPQPPRGPGPKLDVALELAQAAIAACRAKGDHVAALVVDARRCAGRTAGRRRPP